MFLYRYLIASMVHWYKQKNPHLLELDGDLGLTLIFFSFVHLWNVSERSHQARPFRPAIQLGLLAPAVP